MSMIDTYGPSRMYLAGRGQALSELANRQQNERAGVDDQRQMMALQQAQARMDAEAQAVARKRAEDDQVSQMLRARILELIPPPEVSMPAGGEKAGPFQPGMEPQATVTDRFGDIRKAAETGGLPVLQALSKLVPDRLRLSQIQNQIDTLIARKDYLDDSPEKTLVDHISGAVRGGNLQDAEAGMRLLIQQQAKQQDDERDQKNRLAFQKLGQAFATSRDAAKAKGAEAERETLAVDLAAQLKIPIEEARRRVRLTKGGVINEGRNQTDETRDSVAPLIKQRDQLMKMAKDGELPTEFGQRDDVQAMIAELDVKIGEALLGGSKQTRPGWRFVTTRPGGMGTDFVFAGPNGEQIVAAAQGIPADLRGLVGGGQPTSTPPAPGAPTQASSGDPMAAARAALGDKATIEQIEQWMEAQGL